MNDTRDFIKYLYFPNSLNYTILTNYEPFKLS